jgi:hypothetical protein
VSTASSTCREGFELRSWMSSEEREDEEGEVRRGSEAEGSRFNVGVMVIVRGNSFYMYIFGQFWLELAVLWHMYIYIPEAGPADTDSRKCETQGEAPLAAIKKRAFQTSTTFQYNAKYKGRNAAFATFLFAKEWL